jgi:SAM-dependent methyltransferase
VCLVSDNWDDIASWWTDEAAADPAYAIDVHPLLVELMPDAPGTMVDLGCGEGQGMRLVGGSVVGVDLSAELAEAAVSAGPVVVAELPGLEFFVPDSFDTAYSVYLLDLIADHAGFFVESARVVRQGGALVIVINHPAYTAPGSAPLLDEDGEVLWRWGDYFRTGSSLEPAGHREIRFHHRPLGQLLTDAAAAGWSLDVMIERALSADTIRALPGYVGQHHIPRLLGVRWIRSTNGSIRRR